MEAALIAFFVVVALISKWILSYYHRYSPKSDPVMFNKLMLLQIQTEQKLRIKTEEAKLTLDILRLVKDGKSIVYEYPKYVITADALKGLEDTYKDMGNDVNPGLVWHATDNERIEKFYKYVNAWLQNDKDADKLYLEYINAHNEIKTGVK